MMDCIINLKQRRLEIGSLEISFNVLQTGGFSFSWYRNKEEETSFSKDKPLLIEAFYALKKAVIAAGPNWMN